MLHLGCIYVAFMLICQHKSNFQKKNLAGMLHLCWYANINPTLKKKIRQECCIYVDMPTLIQPKGFFFTLFSTIMQRCLFVFFIFKSVLFQILIMRVLKLSLDIFYLFIYLFIFLKCFLHRHTKVLVSGGHIIFFTRKYS